MKKALVWILALTVSFATFAQEQKSTKMLSLECGGKTILAPVSAIWSLVPFVGNPEGLYKAATGENDHLIHSQQDAVGNRDNLTIQDTSVNGGIVSPVIDLLNLSLGKVMDMIEKTEFSKQYVNDAKKFPTTTQNFAPAVLLRKEAIAACSDLLSRINESDRNTVKETSQKVAKVVKAGSSAQ